jgi:RNA polymerase sigma-70 factor (ECF subfamily)
LLFERISDGDENSFKDLFFIYAKKLLPYLTRLTKSESIAKEFLQETFLRLWLKRDGLAEIDNPSAWIFRIASNQAFTWLKKKLTEETAIQKHYENNGPAQIFSEDPISITELRFVVNKAVEKLPAQRKKIFLLSRDAGMKPSEIAQYLNISVSTVKNSLASATRFVREYVEKSGYSFLLLLLFLTKK